VYQYQTGVTPESEDKDARLEIWVIKGLKGAIKAWQPRDRRIYGTMKAKAHTRLARLFAKSEMPVATKAPAARIINECWDELTQDAILSACDVHEAHADDEDDDKVNNDDDNAIIDVESEYNDSEDVDR
jgi:hypothetical protein